MSALILLNLISIIVIKSTNAGAPRIVGGIEANIGKKQFAEVFLIHYLVVKVFCETGYLLHLQKDGHLLFQCNMMTMNCKSSLLIQGYLQKNN